MKQVEYFYSDFTAHKFSELLKIAKENYRFIFYTEINTHDRFLLWRHDVDFSLVSALTLAEIEAKQGIKATYFLLLHSDYYNLMSVHSLEIVKKILNFGHAIGLHFDSEYYAIQTQQQLEQYLLFEKEFLERLFGQEIQVFSFHNPTVYTMSCRAWKYSGMINAYAEFFQKEIGYCSDSNGYWRFRRLEDVLLAAGDRRLQVLTHPVWWTHEVLSPRERISLCINRYTEHLQQNYDRLLQDAGRLNLK